MANGAPTVSNGLVISGVTTSTTFSGSGASLTNLNGSNIASGTVPVARIGTGTKSTSTFYRGDGTFATVTPPAITTINSASNNRLVTSDGGTTVTAEANLTFDGTVLTSDQIRYAGGGNKYHGHPRSVVIGYSGSNYANLGMGWVPTTTNGQYTSANTDYQSRLQLYDGLQIYGSGASVTSGQTVTWNTVADFKPSAIKLYTSGNSNSEKLRITSTGNIGINTTTPENNSNDVSLHIHGTANDDCRIAFSTPTKSNPGSRIGYYGLNRFGIDTYDGLEVRDVTASYATRFKIDSNGYVTMPNTPAASAYVSSSSPGAANNKINPGTLGLNNTHYNNGGHFNTSNYRFTCPVTGYYKVSFSTNLHTSNHSDGQNYQVNLQVNGSTRHIHYDTKQSSHTWLFMGWAETVYCSANDYISLSIGGNAVLGVDSSSAWNRTTFELIG